MKKYFLKIACIVLLISVVFVSGCGTGNAKDTAEPYASSHTVYENTSGNTQKSTETSPPLLQTTESSDIPAAVTPIEASSTEPVKTEKPTPTKTPEKTENVKTPGPSKTPAKGDGTLKGIVIGIDPGHQGKGNSELEPIAPGSDSYRKKVSSGTQGKWSRVPEYEVTLIVGLELKKLLEAEGATVLMSRETHDVNISNSERAILMNNAGADIVIRIHCNGNDNTSVYGACMLVPAGANNKQIHEESRKAGEVILESFVEATGAKNNGVVKRSDLSGFNWSEVPVCLIEMGYMSNKEEDILLTQAAYQKKCADGLYKGLLEWFSR